MSGNLKKQQTSEFRITDVKKTVRIVRPPSDQDKPITIAQLLSRTIDRFGDRLALMSKDNKTNKWTGITYKKYKENVEKLAKCFIKLGLDRHGVVGILASNCAEWFISDMAAVHAGGVFTGIYISNSPAACHHVLKTSRAKIVVVDDLNQLQKILEVRDKLPDLIAIVQISEPFDKNLKRDVGYWRFEQLLKINTDDVQLEYVKRLADINPAECCSILFTSGTVGNPKGAMISHDNLTWTVTKIAKALDLSSESQEVIMSYLPLSHMAGQSLDVFFSLHLGATVYFAEKNAMKFSFMQTLVEVKPTFFIGVPRIYEKLQDRLVEIDKRANIQGAPLGLEQKRAALGFDRCKNMLTGAAPMSMETRVFFQKLNLPILGMYGMTEAVGITLSPAGARWLGCNDGKCIDGSQLKILNPDKSGQGEICVKGRQVFMGYINDEAKTSETLDDDRWLHTGDLGFIDVDGYVYITGRIKEIIITSGGENVSPNYVENLVKAECPALSNVFLVGDRKKFLSVLLTLKTQVSRDGYPKDELSLEATEWLRKFSTKQYRTLSELLNAGPDRNVLQAIQEAIDHANKKSISNAQRVQKFAILPRDFCVLTGELGPSLKLKRNVVLHKYKDIVETFYKRS